MPSPLLQVDSDWYQLVEIDQRELFGYVDVEIWDEDLAMIPLPDRKHWLEVKNVLHDKKLIEVSLWAYTDEDSKNSERVTICQECGVLISACNSKKHKKCPDCHDFGVVHRDTAS